MFLKKKVNSFILFLITSSILVLFKYFEISGLYLHDYLTNIFYYNLVVDVQSDDFVFSTENLILSSIKNIFSAEPFLALIYYFSGLIFDEHNTFYITSFIFFITTLFFIFKLKLSFVFFVFSFPLFFGFYEFVIFSMTHRLKFAIIFFSISMYYLMIKKNNKFWFCFFLISVFTHFSILIYIPLVLLHFKLVNKEVVNNILILLFLIVISLLLFDYILGVTQFYYFQKIFHYIDFEFNVVMYFFVILIIFSYFFTNFIRFNFLFLLSINILFFIFVTFVLGTGRTLMLFYFYLYFYNLFSCMSISNKTNTHGFIYNVNNLLFIPFYFYNLFKGFTNNPMFNSTGSFFY